MICERPLPTRVGIGYQEHVHKWDILLDTRISLVGVGLVLDL